MVKPVGAVPGAVGVGGAAEAGDDGACALRLVSQTSFGSTVANSRSTRSHDTRRESAEATAETRAFCSPASPASIAVCAFGSGGSTASRAFASPSACRLSVTDQLAPRNMTESAIDTTSSRPSPTKIGAFSAGVRFARSSRGRRLTARTARLVLDPETDRDGERADRLGVTDALSDPHPRERVADADAHADQAFEVVGEPAEVRGAAGEDDLADAERAGLPLVELERGDELPREGLHLAPNRLPGGRRLLLGESLGRRAVGERERALDRLRLRRA